MDEDDDDMISWEDDHDDDSDIAWLAEQQQHFGEGQCDVIDDGGPFVKQTGAESILGFERDNDGEEEEEEDQEEPEERRWLGDNGEIVVELPREGGDDNDDDSGVRGEGENEDDRCRGKEKGKEKAKVHRFTAAENRQALDVHKAHLACLVARCSLVSRWAGDRAVRAAMVSCLPAELLPKKKKSVPDSGQDWLLGGAASGEERNNGSRLTLASLAVWFRDFIAIVDDGAVGGESRGGEGGDGPWGSRPSRLLRVIEQRVGCAQEAVQLFVALCRGLGLRARYVACLDPLPPFPRPQRPSKQTRHNTVDLAVVAERQQRNRRHHGGGGVSAGGRMGLNARVGVGLDSRAWAEVLCRDNKELHVVVTAASPSSDLLPPQTLARPPPTTSTPALNRPPRASSKEILRRRTDGDPSSQHREKAPIGKSATTPILLQNGDDGAGGAGATSTSEVGSSGGGSGQERGLNSDGGKELPAAGVLAGVEERLNIAREAGAGVPSVRRTRSSMKRKAPAAAGGATITTSEAARKKGRGRRTGASDDAAETKKGVAAENCSSVKATAVVSLTSLSTAAAATTGVERKKPMVVSTGSTSHANRRQEQNKRQEQKSEGKGTSGSLHNGDDGDFCRTRAEPVTINEDKTAAENVGSCNRVAEGKVEAAGGLGPHGAGVVVGRVRERWVHVDPLHGAIDQADKVQGLRFRKRVMPYVVAEDERHLIVDVTRRYSSEWSRTLRTRGRAMARPGGWWNQALLLWAASADGGDHRRKAPGTGQADRPFVVEEAGEGLSGGSDDHRASEEKELEEKVNNEPIPSTIVAFKNHHVYVLWKNLLKFEGLRPGAKVAGLVKGSKVYLKSDVATIRGASRWKQEGLKVKDSELNRPTKVTTKKGEKDGEGTAKLFGDWQTEAWVPEAVVNGKVPKNEYGNVEFFSCSPAFLPPGAAYIQGDQIGRVAARLAVDYAPALTGFETKQGRQVPVLDGIIVCKGQAQMLREAHMAWEQATFEKQVQARGQRALRRWRTLFRGVLLGAKLLEEYGDHD